MKKRYLAALLLIVCLLPLAGCGKFKCDGCGKETSGKKNKVTILGETATQTDRINSFSCPLPILPCRRTFDNKKQKILRRKPYSRPLRSKDITFYLKRIFHPVFVKRNLGSELP